MNEFYQLFTQFLKERTNKLQWELIQPPKPNQVIPYSELDSPKAYTEKSLLDKLAIVKLNGGLGTSMGCTGPKSSIEVRDGLSFLDLTVLQIQKMNQTNKTNTPLILMNSFNTEEEMKRAVNKYSSPNNSLPILMFNQSKYPRICRDTLVPIPKTPADDKRFWYPPGHGDFYRAIYKCGLLDRLIAEGKEYLFVSNIDNLGATVDMKILAYMIESQADFLMEVTEKTRADIKGGTLINYEGNFRLLEVSQVPPEHLNEFVSVKKFKIFNTNNIWISTRALKAVLTANAESPLKDLEIVVNPKTIENDGRAVLQLETAIGSMIKKFSRSVAVNVPRSRFLPVKNCSDLLGVQSDLYTIKGGTLCLNPSRPFPGIPLVKLGDHFKKVSQYQMRFGSPPRMLELEHLTVLGDVRFGANVVLKGTVIIIASSGNRIDIPSGAVLEDKVISGNLCVTEY